MNVVEMTRRDLEYYINLVDKVAVKSESLHSNFDRSSTVEKMLSNSVACHREGFQEIAHLCRKLIVV
jgi:hypothetical protein